jgi:hypothetical protein
VAAGIARLKAAHPKITLKLLGENSKIVQQLLRDKLINVGIYEQTRGFLDRPRFDDREDRLVLV